MALRSLGHTIFAISMLVFPNVCLGQPQDAGVGNSQTDAQTQTAQPPDPQRLQARLHIAQGTALFNAGNFDASVSEFEQAYSLLEGHPNRYQILFNIGQANERLFRYDQAIEFYQRYLTEGGDSVTDREQIQINIQALENLLATIDVTINIPEAEIWIDNRLVGRAPGHVRTPTGSRNIEVRQRGYSPSRQRIEVAARGRYPLRFQLEPLGRFRGLHPAIFGTVTATAVVCAGVGTVMGAQVLMARGNINDRLTPQNQFTITQREIDDINRNALIADIFFGATALFAVSAGILGFVTDFRGNSRQEQTQPRASLPRLVPSIVSSPGHTVVQLGGEF